MQSQGRVYVPAQLANRRQNEAVFDAYVYGNPNMDPQMRAAARPSTG